MLPGKKYTIDDYLLMAWKRRWWILVPLVAIGSATAVVSHAFLKNRYRASTSILVIPQRVPEDLVQSTVTANLSERLNIIREQILSRTRLERIIQEFDLYKPQRERLIMQDVVEGMRRDISLSIQGPRSRRDSTPSSFAISFESEDQRTAMRVTERLASLFVQENLEERSNIAGQTDLFLKSQLDEARRRLVDHENDLATFRMKYNGQLPDQVTSNLSLMQSSNSQLQAVVESTNRDRDRLLSLERALAEAPSAAVTSAPPAPSGGNEGATASSAAQQLDAARQQLSAMLLRLKPEHPDIGRAKRVIAELEAKAETEALNQPLSTTTAAPVVVRDRNAQNRIDTMRAEIEELRNRIESGKREAARLQTNIASFQSKVEVAPKLEAELSEKMRDYRTLQEGYSSLLRKNEESRIAMNLEQRQIGEQFKVIDGARLPERPVSPDRVRIDLLGVLGGLALGLALVALLEYRDTTFKTDDDLVATLALPVIAVIPIMISGAERKALRRRRLMLAAGASVGCVVLAAAVVLVWRSQLVESWLR